MCVRARVRACALQRGVSSDLSDSTVSSDTHNFMSWQDETKDWGSLLSCSVCSHAQTRWSAHVSVCVCVRARMCACAHARVCVHAEVPEPNVHVCGKLLPTIPIGQAVGGCWVIPNLPPRAVQLCALRCITPESHMCNDHPGHGFPACVGALMCVCARACPLGCSRAWPPPPLHCVVVL